MAEGEVREAARVVNGLEARVREQAAVVESGVREWAVAGDREFGELDALRREGRGGRGGEWSAGFPARELRGLWVLEL